MKKEQKAIVTISLIITNAVVFIILMLLGKSEDTWFILEHGAMYEPYIIENHEYYRLVTCMFLHFGIDHLVNNMLMLGAMGWNLEFEIGKIRFLIIYFLSGIFGNVCSLYFDVFRPVNAVSAGASGAVFGVMGALLCAAIKKRGYVGRLNKRGLIFMSVFSLYLGFRNTGVDNAAHVGGFIAGFLLQFIVGIPRKKRYQYFQ